MREPWVYRGTTVYPADFNSSGIRWTALCLGDRLRADTKEGMRELINHAYGGARRRGRHRSRTAHAHRH